MSTSPAHQGRVSLPDSEVLPEPGAEPDPSTAAASTSAPAAPREEYHRAVSRCFFRNKSFFIGFDGLWGMGMPFATFAAMVPAYLGHLQVSRTTLTLMMALPWLCIPLQICGSIWLGGRRRKVFMVGTHLLAVVPWLTYSIVLLLLPDLFGAGARTGLYLAAIIWFMAAVSLGGPLHFEMLTDATPLLRRGGLAGYRSAAAGLAGLASGGIAFRVMQDYPEPTNFLISFTIGLFCYSLASLLLLGVRDHLDPSRLRRNDRTSIVNDVRLAFTRIWGNANCRIYLFFHALLVLAMIQAPLIVDAASRQLGATSAQQSRFALIVLVSLIGPIWCLGRLADRFGYRVVACIIAALLCTCFVMVLSSLSLTVWYVAFAFYAVAMNLEGTVLGNMCVELVPQVEPGKLLSVARMILLPFILVSTLLSGLLGDARDTYLFAFMLGATLTVIAGLGFLLLANEPRTGRLYVIKTLPRQ